jgi:hypothetical protein
MFVAYLFGSCVTYGASVQGSLTISLEGSDARPDNIGCP